MGRWSTEIHDCIGGASTDSTYWTRQRRLLVRMMRQRGG
ncbi:hypothetical protein CCACVL1_29691 [Corchorus capsularis]|uniref:Uncharacterized protein n=1 Tax=Corchorus capsularis TaxID=210143 RepID=A0A1R3G0H7_COCAP|nr:hypothetical protein CCACVL1_29691 [Corchorus capsularis]